MENSWQSPEIRNRYICNTCYSWRRLQGR